MEKTIGQLFGEYRRAKREFERAAGKSPRPWAKAFIKYERACAAIGLRWLDTFGGPF